MKRFLSISLALLLSLALSGCVGIGRGSLFDDIGESSGTLPQEPLELKHIEHVGEVPENFTSIISDNLYNAATVNKDVIIKNTSNESTIVFQTFDIYGKKHAEFSFPDETNTRTVKLYRISGDRYISVSYFTDRLISKEENWASENTSINKDTVFTLHGAHGNNQEYINRSVLDDPYFLYITEFFETDDGFIFAGEYENAETKTAGIGSKTDIVIIKLDKEGDISNVKTIKGSDYDSLSRAGAEYEDGVLRLYIRAQSSDGDYPEDGFWIFDLDQNLEIINKTKTEYKNIPDEALGYIDGNPIRDITEFVPDFDAGQVSTITEYDDFVLVVSEHNTGVFENMPPYVSSIWFYTETVYSAYSKDGTLLWRSAVDSSDYELFDRYK